MLNVIKLVSVAEMKAIEGEANEKGLSYSQMMENAGNNLGKIVEEQYESFRDQGIIGLVGSGNNGGDTLVALDYLAKSGWTATAYIIKPRLPDDSLILRLSESNGKIFHINDDPDLNILDIQLLHHRIILDGIFGTGIKLPLSRDVERVITRVNMVVQNGEQDDRKIIIAVDCPSGIDCDTGETSDEVIKANLTVTMAAIKDGLFCFPAAEKVGNIRVAEIGLTDEIQAWSSVKRFVIDENWIRSKLPKRPLNAHKGTFGTAFIVAGSLNYTGAALLAGKAAYLAGAGLVTTAIPKPLHQVLSGQFPEGTWVLMEHEAGFISHAAYKNLFAHVNKATALLIGPGLGLKKTTKMFLEAIFRSEDDHKGLSEKRVHTLPPLVIDADGLKLVVQLHDWQKLLPSETILTPHPGEMAVMTGLSIDEIQNHRFQIALKFAKEWDKVVVLKGAYTIIAAADGRVAAIPVATPALARAGTGDVLAGLIVGLRAQGMNSYDAAVTGAWLHGQAGLMSAKMVGSTACILAGDILHGVVDVFRQLNS